MSALLHPQPHIVIVGAGFGGLRAAHTLAGAGTLAGTLKGVNARVTLVDRNNYHLFQPLLYQVATAGLAADEIAQPVRAMLRNQPNLEFRIAAVRGIDFERRELDTERGPLAYDYLILAAGGTTNYFGLASPADLPRGLFGLKTLDDAEAIRNHLLSMCEQALDEPDAQRRKALLTFAIAGGGPSGVESAGAVAELVEHILPRDYPRLDPAEVRVILLEAGARLLPALPETLAKFTEKALLRKGVDVRFGAAVAGYDGQIVRLQDGPLLPARTLVWAAGVKAAPLFDGLDLEKGSLGRVRVGPTLQVNGRPEVFIIGDAALCTGPDGKALPMVAPVAMQQGESAARSVLRLASGEEALPFIYHDPGVMATIGRGQAVARLGPLNLRGVLAWLAWVVVHIFQLVGFRNRLLVMVDWAWNYFAYDRPVRRLARSPWAKEHSPAGD
jgi:NADH:ubiquinone reductase (H+-translocating)